MPVPGDAGGGRRPHGGPLRRGLGAVRAAWYPAVAAGVVLAVFARVVGHDFVNWDDTTLLIRNLAWRGLGPEAVRHAFTTTLLGHYVPLTWLSFGLDYVVWGLEPGGYHLTNLLLHAANAALFCVLARRLLARATTLSGPPLELGALAGALFFAVHPLRVESVAWVTERRGVLSGLLALVAVLLYLRAAEAAGGRRVALLASSTGAFCLALAAKGSVLVLPAGLVILDVYPLRRLPPPGARWLERAARPVWWEKLPYVLVAGVWAVVIAWSYVSYQVVRLEPVAWLALVARSLWHHVQKEVLPLGLSPLYELPPGYALADATAAVAALGVAGVTALVVLRRRAWPAAAAAWAWHAVALAPVMAIAHAGPQVTADRYGYLPSWGWALLVGAAAGATARAAARRRPPALALGLVWLAAFAGLAALTVRQVAVWEHTTTLWRHAVAVGPECVRCRRVLGDWLLRQGQGEAALAEFEWLRARSPEDGHLDGAVGNALVALGRHREAEGHFRRAAARLPGADGALMRANLAGALIESGRPGEGLRELRAAVRAWGPEAMIAHFQEVVRSRPHAPVPRLVLAEAYRAAGRRDDAAGELAALARLRPALARLAEAPAAP